MSILNNIIPTEEQREKDLKIVANIKDKNEKLSWTRRQKKIEQLVIDMQPLDEKLISLMAEKQIQLDKIFELRKQMVKECIHPKNSLVHKGNYIDCKFCNAKLSIPKER